MPSMFVKSISSNLMSSTSLKSSMSGSESRSPSFRTSTPRPSNVSNTSSI